MKCCWALGKAQKQWKTSELCLFNPPLPKRHPEHSLTDGDPACVRKHINQRGPFAQPGVSGPPPCFPSLTLSRLHLRMRLSRGRCGTRKRADERAGAFRSPSPLAEPSWRSGRSSRLPGARFRVGNSSDFHCPPPAKLKWTLFISWAHFSQRGSALFSRPLRSTVGWE